MTISKCFGVLVLALGLTVASAPDADARPRPAGRQSNFEANKTFGLGLIAAAGRVRDRSHTDRRCR